MSSAHFAKSVSKTKAKKKAWTAFSLYLRTLWTQKGSVQCYTCGKGLVLKAPRAGLRVTVGHWVEGHSNSTYINETYVRPQCYYCNIMIGGNQGEFRDRIRKELGDKIVDQLLIDAKKKIDIEATEYMDMASYYKVKLKELDR